MWGLSYPLTKIALGGMSPFVLAFVRFSVGGVALLIYSRGIRIGVKEAINGVLNVFLLVVFLNLSLIFTTNPALASVLIYTQPLFILLIGRALGDNVSTLRSIGVILGFIGIVISVGSTNLNPGTLLAVAGGLSWAIGTIYFRRRLPQGDLLKLNSFMALLSALLVTPLMLVNWVFDPTVSQLTAAVVVGLTAQAIGFVLWFSAVKELGPINAGATSVLVPVAAYILSFTILGVVPSAVEALGSGVALVGVGLSQFGDRLVRYRRHYDR